MGCLHGALLSRAAEIDVCLLDHRPQRAAQIQHQGVIVESAQSTDTVPIHCTADPGDLPAPDLLIVFTKAYDAEAAIRRSEPLIGSHTAVLTLQNGLGNYQILQEYVAPEEVLAGTTSSGATLLGPGHIRQAGVGEIVLGSPVGNSDLAGRAAAIFESARLSVQITDDVDAILWRKTLINCAINPLTALTRLSNGELLEIPALHKLLMQVAEEVYEVGTVVGTDWGDFAPVKAVEQVCTATAANQSSMLQDVQAARRTEIDYINGAIAQIAREHHTTTPLCECLTALVRGHSPQSRSAGS